MSETARQIALRELCNRFGLKIPAPGQQTSNSGEEDVAAYFGDDAEPLGQYVSLTQHESDDHQFVYAYAYDTLEAAQERCVEFIGDDIFEEVPVGVFDLDSHISGTNEFGKQWLAHIRIEWEAKLNLQLEAVIAEAEKALAEEVPWAAATYAGDSDQWGDEQDRSEYFEGQADALGGLLRNLITLIREEKTR